MYFFFLLFFLSGFAIYFSNQYDNLNINIKKFFPFEIFYLLTFFLIFSFYIIFSSQGTDFTTYNKNYYELSKENLDYFFIKKNIFDGFLFKLLGLVFIKFKLSFFYYILIFKFLFIVGFFLLTKNCFLNKKNNIWIPLNFFCINFLSIQSITFLNQISAIGIFFYILSLKRNSFIKDIILGLFAFSCHKTGVIVIFFIFAFYFIKVFRIKNNFIDIASNKFFFLIIISSTIFSMILFNFKFNNFVVPGDQLYYLNESTFGFVFRSFYIFLIYLFFIHFCKEYEKILDRDIFIFIHISFFFYLFLIIISVGFSTISDRLLLYSYPFVFLILASSLNFKFFNKKTVIFIFVLTNFFLLNLWLKFSPHSIHYFSFQTNLLIFNN